MSPDLHPRRSSAPRVATVLALVASGGASLWSRRQVRVARDAQRRAEDELARLRTLAPELVATLSGPTHRPAAPLPEAEATSAEALHWRHQALHDNLTELANRGGLLESLEMLSEPPVYTGRAPCAVLYADLDGFKSVNDTHGHRAGDEVLKTVAERLRNLVRPGDTVARIGGDEFVIVLDAVGDEESALLIAERIRRGIAAPIPIGDSSAAGDGSVSVNATFGIALGDDRDASALLDRADAALYAGKRAGRDRCSVWTPAAPQMSTPLAASDLTPSD